MAAIAWGLVVLGLTFVILLLGAIVLPAQADKIPAEYKVHNGRTKPQKGKQNANTISPGAFHLYCFGGGQYQQSVHDYVQIYQP